MSKHKQRFEHYDVPPQVAGGKDRVTSTLLKKLVRYDDGLDEAEGRWANNFQKIHGEQDPLSNNLEKETP